MQYNTAVVVVMQYAHYGVWCLPKLMQMLISVLVPQTCSTHVAVSFDVLYVLYVAGCCSMLLAIKVTQLLLTDSRSQYTHVCVAHMYVVLSQFISAAMFSCSCINFVRFV